jgi:uncharacterized protein (TIRG00374 family)
MIARAVAILKRPWVRVLVQAIVSLALIGVLVVAARSANLAASLRSIQPITIAIAAGLQILAIVLNSRRWQLLLANVGIRERLFRLVPLYFIGMFCSLFLPTGTGGDVVRTYDVARRSGRPTEAIMATVQERLLGLGASLLVGLVAMLYYLPLLPAQLQIWMVIIAFCGASGIALLLYPQLLFGLVGRIWRAQSHRPLLKRIAGQRLVARALAAIRPIGELPPLQASKLAVLLGIAIMSVLIGAAIHYVIGRSIGVQVGPIAFCMVVPLVWIVRMAPISLNGIGVGEGSFVFLMSLLGVPAEKSLALALAVLGTLTGVSLLGGVLLAWRISRGTWSNVRRPATDQPAEVAHEHR